MERVKAARLPRVACLVGLFAIAIGSSAASGRALLVKAAPSVVVAHWHEVASDLALANFGAVAAASDRYLAVITAQSAVSLLNTSTNQITPLSPPDCATPGGVSFGGPWLGVGCSASSTNPSGVVSYVAIVDLLNLSTGQWTVRPLDPTMCEAQGEGCGLDSVGSTWIRFVSGGASEHNPQATYQQNIATGVVKSDNAFAGGSTDNLNNASGLSHPCVALPTGGLDEDFLGTGAGGFAPYFGQLGRFLLRTPVNEGDNPPNVLQACGSQAQILIPDGFVATNAMVLWPQHVYGPPFGLTIGLSLPALRPIEIRVNKGPIVAASDDTLYETTINKATYSTTLWATTVPKFDLVKNAAAGT